MQLKTTYEGKCRDADRAEENHTRLQSNPTTKPKDLQQVASPGTTPCLYDCDHVELSPLQAQKRMEGSRSAANNADTAYQEMVKNLEEARQLWDREMELLCKVGRRRVEQSERREGKQEWGEKGKWEDSI